MIAALDGHERGTVANDALLQQTAFRVYRNTVRLGALDALRANYPTAVQLVGEEWFCRRCASISIDSPSQPVFAGLWRWHRWLSSPHWMRLPNCPICRPSPRWIAPGPRHIARLTRRPRTADMQALLGSGERIYPHPATRASGLPTPRQRSCGVRRRSGVDDLSTIEWQGAGALLTRAARRGPVVGVRRGCHCAGRMASAAGVGIADAIEQTASRFGAETTGRAFHQLLNQGALTTAPAGESS